MRIITYYIPWLCLCIPIYILHAYVSNLNSISNGKYTLLLYLTGIIPVWTFMSAHSKDVAFDGILFDVIVLLTYAISINIFANRHFNTTNWIGLGIIIIGILMVKK